MHRLFLMTTFALCLASMNMSCGNSKDTESPGVDNRPSEGIVPEPKVVVPAPVVEEPPVFPEKPVPVVMDWNAAAQVLGGFTEDFPKTHQSLLENKVYQEYVKNIKRFWKPVDQKRGIVEKWVEKELSAINANCKTLFYPFSGPDFLHAHLLFPSCTHIVMIGLEPTGTLREFSDVLKNKPEKFFRTLEQSLRHILTISFFRTKSMQEHYSGKEVPELDGTLAPILFMMARTGMKITRISRVSLDWDGNLVPWTGEPLPERAEQKKPLEKKRSGTGKKAKPEKKKIWQPVSGMKFEYVTPDGKDHTLVYYSCNLANETYRQLDGLRHRPDMRTYLEKLHPSVIYTKAASYLMHQNTFSWIRSYILEHGPHVLQDDSGIPVRFFEEDKWNLVLYGTYEEPIELFDKYRQKDLAAYYKEWKNRKPLPFGIGYKIVAGRSNLMLASRKN